MAAEYTITHTSYGEELADIDVSTLTLREAHDLRLELTHDVLYSEELISKEVKDFYIKKVKEIKTLPDVY